MEEIKYIKIYFRKCEPIYLSKEKWRAIIESEKTLVPYKLDTETEWTGRTMNLSEVTSSEYDEDYTKKANERKFVLYRNKETNTVVKCFEGELIDNLDKYEKLT